MLGIGGLRALKALGMKPTVYHMNEGHSAFLAIERIRVLMEEEGLTFDEALEARASNNVFTTHTSVPAGIDLFDPAWCTSISASTADQAGSRSTSCWRWAAATLNDSSRAVFDGHPGAQDLGLPQRGEPAAPPGFAGDVAGSVAQAAGLGGSDHLRHQRRASAHLDQRRPGGTLRSVSAAGLARAHGTMPRCGTWSQEIPGQELWEAHRRRKRRLVTFVRERAVPAPLRSAKRPAAEVRRCQEVLDPDAFTIGFARRFATYKRATLLFRDVERLKRILTNPEHAGADRHRRQGASQGYPGQDADPRDRAVSRATRNCRSTSCSWRITAFKWRAKWCRAWTCG